MATLHLAMTVASDVQWLQQKRSHLAVLLMVRDLADRLHQLHKAYVVHRDLKPSNVLWLIHTQAWCLLDLGIADETGAERG
jgi:serine/threonine protein kinase